MNFKGRVALVTGATRGIGFNIASELLKNNCTVFITGCSRQDKLDSAKKELSAFGSVDGLLGNIGDYEFNRILYKSIFEKYKRLDILVNNAGVLEDSLLGMITPDMVAKVFQTNVFGVIYNMQMASRLMQRNRYGSIINLSSIIGTNGNEGQVVYSASKAAVIGATKSASKELAAFSIRVNSIAPGFIDTDMTKQLPQDKYIQRISSIKMQRIGTTQDIANLTLFLASENSSYITGQIIGVDGGMLI